MSETHVRWNIAGQRLLLSQAEEMLKRPGRTILGITGAPGAGKSTISEWLFDHLSTRYPQQVALVPMDGYHLAQSVLEARGLEDRKGSPDTFDAHGFIAMLRQLRMTDSHELFAPTFRREINDAVAGAIAIPISAKLILTEGNYLLLDSSPWDEIVSFLDEVWFIQLDQEERLRRLTARHLHFEHDLTIARRRAHGNDENNALLIAATVERSTLVVDHIANP